MARTSDLAVLNARIEEAGLHVKGKTEELIAFLKSEVVAAQRVVKKVVKGATK